MGKIKLFYKIGLTGEKVLFEEYRDFYDGIAIGGHFAAFYSNWLPAFLINLKKLYFIDPMTYVFARNLDAIRKEEELKKSYEKLRKAYGGILEKITENRQLVPKDFQKQKLSNEIAKSVIKFQANLVADKSQKSLAEYLGILGKKEAIIGPEFLVSPYFYFSSLEDLWYKISLNTAKASLKHRNGGKIYAVICTSKAILLDESAPEKLKKDYVGFDGYLILISDFREREEDEGYLKGLVNVVKTLAQFKKPIYLLYGGYFSLLLSKYGLEGYSRSICYGETKNIGIEMPATVARLPKGYYLNFAHSKIPESAARAFYSENIKLLCNCSVCSRILSQIKEKDGAKRSEKFFDSIDFNKEARAHFMITHHLEIKEIAELSLEKLIEKLQNDYNASQKVGAKLYNIPTEHLIKWINATKGYK